MSLFGIIIGFNTIVIKEIKRFLRIWIQTLLPPAITTMLYFVIFGSLIGKSIGDVSGHSYSEFIAPGLIMMAIINNSYANVVSSFFGAKFHGHIQEMIISPLPCSIVLMGFVTGGLARGLLVGVVVSLVSMYFTDWHVYNVWVVVWVVILTSILLALAGFINAYYARTFDGMNIVPIFILAPLTYLGGVFYSISTLPEFWQIVSRFNPILYMVNGFRYGFLGISDTQISTTFIILIVTNLVLYQYAIYLLKKGKGVLDY